MSMVRRTWSGSSTKANRLHAAGASGRAHLQDVLTTTMTTSSSGAHRLPQLPIHRAGDCDQRGGYDAPAAADAVKALATNLGLHECNRVGIGATADGVLGVA